MGNWLLTFLCLLLYLHTSWKVEGQIIRVLVFPFDPFVTLDNNGTYTGFGVDVWEQVTLELNTAYGYSITNDYINTSVVAFNRNLRDNADIGIYGFAVTQAQQVMFATSIPYKFSILRALGLVSLRKTTFQVIGDIFSNSTFLQLILLLFLWVIGSSILIWIMEHRRNEDQFHRNFFTGHGISLYMVWITITTVGYGDVTPKTPWGKVSALVSLIVSIILLDLVSGTVSSILTVTQLQPAPLSRLAFTQRNITAFNGSYAVQYAMSVDANVAIVNDLSTGLETIRNQSSTYFLGDQDVMLGLNFTVPDVLFVGTEFVDLEHNFLFPNTSSADTQFYSDVNQALSSVKATAAYFELYKRYFVNVTNGEQANASTEIDRDWIPVIIFACLLAAYALLLFTSWGICGILNRRHTPGVGRQARLVEQEQGMAEETRENIIRHNRETKPKKEIHLHHLEYSEQHPHATRLGLPTR